MMARTSTSPRVVLIMMGKKTSNADIIIIESGFKVPNQLMRIGAAATSGMVLMPMATGSSTSRRTTQRAIAKATTTPATVPMSEPTQGLIDGRGRRPATRAPAGRR